MRLLAGLVVLLVHLDGLVRLGGDQPRAGLVEAHGKDARLAVHGAGLDGRLEALEVVACTPVPEEHSAVIAAGNQDAVRIRRHAIDDGRVAGDVLDEVALRTAPLLDVIRRGGGEHVERRMEDDAAHRLLVVCQRTDALAGGQVPQTHCGVVGAGDDLRVRRLGHHTGHRVRVARQGVNIGLGSHIPYPGRGVSAGCGQHIDRGMQRQRVDGRQMAVVVTDDLVVLQIPALHLPILAATEQIRMLGADRQAAHCTDVACERELQLAAGQVPDLDDTVRRSSGEPLVSRLHGDAAHPAGMARDDAGQLPGGVPLGLGYGWRLLGYQLQVGGAIARLIGSIIRQ